MTVTVVFEENEQAFKNAVLREMILIEGLLADVPAMQRKRDALRAVLVAYGHPMLPLEAAVVEDVIPKSATAEQLDELAARPVTHDENHKPIPKAPIAKSIERVPPPAEKPGRGPKPTDINRPEGIPTNFDMCRLVLIDAAKPLTATEIRDRVRLRWWPNAPDDWKSSPFGFLGSGKLRKNADNKFELGSGSPTAVAKRADPQAIINREAERRVLPAAPVKAPMPPVKPTAGPRPAQAIKFEHGDKSTILSTTREYTIAGKLRAAMGNGHVTEAFLAEKVLASNTEYHRMMIKDICLGMNPALADVGLKIEHYPGFGFLMKDVAV